MHIKIKEDEYDKIVEMYNSGLSKEKIQTLYNVSNSVIDRIFRIKNISCRDNAHKGRKYQINENYFDIINTPNKAYILGLLYSDGNNYPPQNHVSLSLQEKDRDIIYKINKELDSTYPIRFRNLNNKNSNHQNAYVLCITSKYISLKLNQLGVVQNKSLILKFPDFISDELMPHFLRGYIDGDGCIFNGRSSFITIASTKEFCEYIQSYIMKKFGFKTSIHNTGNKNSNTKILVMCTLKNVKYFLDWIYKDAELYIDRKYQKYLAICEKLNNSLAV